MKEGGELILYTTLGCSLCEKAKKEIWPLLARFDLRLHAVDIADDAYLLERFQSIIPAVGLGDPEDVCLWPFDRLQLQTWLIQRLG
ncbi:glutaredoxin family protein [Microbulbifer spongiae]|uniref:Glutaredoxin family protein n=1 Tax=Microbulbifer spongiae TaxID=2944933 RepID=A0ABY9EEA2_9GAMM|nr:glutaredoxin family protein [Microbulbifer sp. MI-G]WKD51324.1 glutaredoxin family protein [Microbulbifer sp. MI-G]